MSNLGDSNINYKFLGQSIIVLSHLFETYLDFRQYKKSKNEKMPQIIKDTKEINVTKEDFIKSKKYTNEKTSFSIIDSTVDTITTIFLIQTNFYPFIWNNLIQKTGSNFLSIILFCLIDGLRSEICSLPFSYYRIFVIEEKYGFNKMTKKLFWTDLAKNFVIGNLINFAFFLTLVWVINFFGNNFFFYAWIITIVLFIGILVIYPSFIAPLFNKFENLDEKIEKEKKIKDKLNELCVELKFPLGNIYKIDGSKRSNHSQAYFFGILKKKQIVIFDTLINNLEIDEIIAVVCHELGHWYYSHNVQMMVANFLNIGFYLYLFQFFLENDKIYYDFGFDGKYVYVGLMLSGTFFKPFSIVIGGLMCFLSRTNEFQADFFAFKKGRGDLLIKGLVKLFKKSHGDLDPDHVYSLFKHTHPSLYQRISAIKGEMRKKVD